MSARPLADDQIVVGNLWIVASERRAVLLGHSGGTSGGPPSIEPQSGDRNWSITRPSTDEVVVSVVTREDLDVFSDIDERGSDHGYLSPASIRE